MEFEQFCCSKPRNFANWPAEFGKISCGKLWAQLVCAYWFVLYTILFPSCFRSWENYKFTAVFSEYY